jgi:hypothetical protein
MCVSADVNRSFAESKLVYDTAILFYDKAHRFFLSDLCPNLFNCIIHNLPGFVKQFFSTTYFAVSILSGFAGLQLSVI